MTDLGSSASKPRSDIAEGGGEAVRRQRDSADVHRQLNHADGQTSLIFPSAPLYIDTQASPYPYKITLRFYIEPAAPSLVAQFIKAKFGYPEEDIKVCGALMAVDDLMTDHACAIGMVTDSRVPP